MRLRQIVVGVSVFLLGALALGGAAAQGAYPGANGVIAFEGRNAVTLTLFTVNADGSGLTDVLQGDVDEHEWWNDGERGSFNPTWSPDGSRIAFDATAGGFNPSAALCEHQLGIWALTLSTGAIEALSCWHETFPAPPNPWPEQFSWSPDGSTLALDEADDQEGDIWLLDADTSTYSLLFEATVDACTWRRRAARLGRCRGSHRLLDVVARHLSCDDGSRRPVHDRTRWIRACSVDGRRSRAPFGSRRLVAGWKQDRVPAR